MRTLMFSSSAAWEVCRIGEQRIGKYYNGENAIAEAVEKCISSGGKHVLEHLGSLHGVWVTNNIVRGGAAYEACGRIIGRCIIEKGQGFESLDRVTPEECDVISGNSTAQFIPRPARK